MVSEWLKVMLEEVARKREEQGRALAEQLAREREKGPAPAPARTGSPRA